MRMQVPHLGLTRTPTGYGVLGVRVPRGTAKATLVRLASVSVDVRCSARVP